jgi:multidrug efflux pump subunit AcrA (membrane-fusion protein)
MTQHILIIWMATAVATFSGLVGCTSKGAASAIAAARAVQVTRVQMAVLDNTLRAVGLLTPKDEARLSFKVGGLIEFIRVEEGQTVKAGQLLAVLKQTEIGASLEQAHQATAKAHRDLERGKALLADGVTTEEQVQDLTTAFEMASAAQSGTEFNAAHARIVASVDGVVLRKLAEANEVVQPGQTVLVLGGANRGWVVRIGLADRDAVRMHLGDTARIEFALTPQGTSQVQVIPVQALLEANDKEAGVFVLDEEAQEVHRVSIQIGRMSAGRIEVLNGLSAGAQVVTDGAAFLENGEKVRVVAQ